MRDSGARGSGPLEAKGEGLEERTSGALSPGSPSAPSPRVLVVVSKLEWGSDGRAPPPDLRCRRPQNQIWPRI